MEMYAGASIDNCNVVLFDNDHSILLMAVVDLDTNQTLKNEDFYVLLAAKFTE